MTPASLSQKIVKKIKAQNLRQKSRWIFVIQHSIFWVLLVASVFFGAKAIALTFNMIAVADLPLLLGPRPRLQILAHILPLFWVISFVLFVAIASWGLQHTPKGYKWTLPRIISINLALSLLLGFIMHITGAASMFDRLIITAIHPSLTAEHYRERLWQRPEHGLLRGKIVEVIDNTHFRLHDPRGRHWTIQYSSGAMRQEAMISSGMFIHLKGTMELHDHFSAEHIRTEQRRMFREQRKSRKSL